MALASEASHERQHSQHTYSIEKQERLPLKLRRSNVTKVERADPSRVVSRASSRAILFAVIHDDTGVGPRQVLYQIRVTQQASARRCFRFRVTLPCDAAAARLASPARFSRSIKHTGRGPAFPKPQGFRLQRGVVLLVRERKLYRVCGIVKRRKPVVPVMLAMSKKIISRVPLTWNNSIKSRGTRRTGAAARWTFGHS